MARRARAGGLTAVLAAAVLAAGPAVALPSLDARFDLELRGFRAGVLTLRTVREGARYAAAARLETTGVAAFLRRVRFDAGVQGQVAGERLHPARYREDVDTGRRESRTVIEYAGGVPRVVSAEPARPPEPWHLDPATQGGTLDPMSVLVSLLADVPTARACRLDLPLFDGRRRGQLLLSPAGAEGDRVVCAGEFRRLAGYSDEELAEARAYPFRLTYALRDGNLQVVEVEAQSPHGRARLVRREAPPDG